MTQRKRRSNWVDPMLKKIFGNKEFGMMPDGTRKEKLGFYTAGTFHGAKGKIRQSKPIVFYGPPCRTLDDMNEDEISNIEKIYKCKVIRNG